MLLDMKKQKIICLGRVLLMVISICLLGCRHTHHQPLILNDFESDADLDTLFWQCRTVYSLSDKNVTHGKASLRLDIYPAPYPGLRLLLNDQQRDWRGYGKLSLDVVNPGQKTLKLNYRLDDKANPTYDDRVNGSVMLRPGLNRITLGLLSLRTSGTKRPLDVRRVNAVLFFLSSPVEKISIYVDFIRLE